MSPLWTRRLAAKPSLKAGIAIGRNHICAAVFDATAEPREMRGLYRLDLPAPLFGGAPRAETEAMLAEALHSVSEGFRATFASVHVALPDTVIRSTVFELDELPRSSEMREALLRWRFAKEWERAEDSLDCRGLDLGVDGGKHLLFGQAADRAWVDCVRRALARAEITPWSLNAAASYRFNHFHEVIVAGEGALLSLDPDCWNLMLWDGAGRVRRVVTRLRENVPAEDEMKSIADEAERAVLSYVRGQGRVGKLYLAGGEEETTALAMMLDDRLHKKAVLLCADLGITCTSAGMRQNLAPLALAAALNL